MDSIDQDFVHVSEAHDTLSFRSGPAIEPGHEP
jgi:hypothetical protein